MKAGAFFSSVRTRLLAIVSLPLVVLPALLGIVAYWANEAYDRLLIYKINAELGIAHGYLERVLASSELQALSLAGSARLAAASARPPVGRGLLEDFAQHERFDFVHLLDVRGKVVASSSDLPVDTPLGHWPVVTSAMTGRASVALDVFDAAELGRISLGLRERARLAVVPTPNAAPDSRTEEDRGLVVHTAAPVLDAEGRLAGILAAGTLLNHNLGFVDRINSIVYTESALPLGSRGTATLFLGDVRVATNVRLFEGGRALGTRVSAEVRRKVLEEGKVWLDRAFVVNDWYVSGYEPLMDSRGQRIGMLYVGFLEEPFRRVKWSLLGAVFVLLLGITVVGSALSLRWAQAIFRPVERMDATMSAVEAGDASARVGPLEGGDEIGRLARRFDRLLEVIERRGAELRELNEQLDRKVIERTEALARANRELRDAQQHLVRSEKLAALGQLTAGVAHEINNPIAVMQGNLDLLRLELGEDVDAVEHELRLLDEQVNRIRVIVTKLLQFARPQEFAGYVERLDLGSVVGDCLVLTRHELKKVGVEVRLALEDGRTARFNRQELQQVLVNLIVNAVHAMPDGGLLTISAEAWEDRGARIVVRDTGAGIAPDHLGRIFDPFFTTKRTSGTGLGLSVSLSLVERYGGTITVTSVPGEGAEFTVWLLSEPRFDEPAAGAAPDAAPGGSPPQRES